VEIGLNPIDSQEGALVLASIVDITERKLQEITLKKQAELEVKNIELEQFAYIASHDLQEPLRTVSSYMQVFEEDYAKDLDENAIKYINSVKKATKRMSAMVKALLDYSRLGRNKKLQSVDCQKLISNVIEDLQKSIESSGAKISIGKMPTLRAYEIEIGQVFQNLITNAIKFKNADTTPKIAISAKMENNSWLFSITDNGIGIASRHYSRIFQIFQRLHSGQVFEGNGIGLANCKKIIELHQGEIWVESELGKGSTFKFTISNSLK
jgi:light-regulated signal transduction histidine kinase (bacteriophytochrome)